MKRKRYKTIKKKWRNYENLEGTKGKRVKKEGRRKGGKKLRVDEKRLQKGEGQKWTKKDRRKIVEERREQMEKLEKRMREKERCQKEEREHIDL